ncbi:hypothetical protein OG218_03850 [Kineococcus sp. NBC_00420]|uniref:IclR family transcriptional regulator domain-containing protein n=1 Tax=Kineococcus sp. NBC_00420 TaxID=2903564 RepID=UPI002E1C10AB
MFAELVRVTPYSISSPRVLARQLAAVRRDGFASTSGEMDVGNASVAVPVRGPDGEVVAALGLVVSSLGRDRPRLVAALTVAAAGVSRALRS